MAVFTALLVPSSRLLRTVAAGLVFGLSGTGLTVAAQQAPEGTAPPAASAPPAAQASVPAAPAADQGAPAKAAAKGKNVYTGPTTIVVLPATPMLDAEGRQR